MRRALLWALVGPALPLAGPPPAAAVEEDCGAVQAGVPAATTAVERPSAPLELMRVAEAQEYAVARGVRPGAGVRVAVLDSGVAETPLVRVVERVSLTGRADLLDWHGTAVAGLIAGRPRADGEPVGVAPAAEIVDVRVYDSPQPADATEAGVTTAGVVAGLRAVLSRPDIDLVNVSLRIGHDPEVERLVRALWRRGTVVIGASGNRPSTGDPDSEELADFVEPGPGQDAASVVFPAGYDEVVAVSATADGLDDARDASAFVLPSSRTDVAAPVVGAVTVGLNGGTCLLHDVVTSWAAAEVTGVLALLKSVHPADSAAELVARLVETADGHPEVRSPYTGAGVVQPLEALRRPVHLAGGELQGTAVAGHQPRAVAPPPEGDAYAGPRRDAVRWAVLGGGAIALALVLRPVLVRRARITGGGGSPRGRSPA